MSDGEQLAVGYLADRNGDPFCSATLVDRDMVVSAGHCANSRRMYFGVGHPDSPQGFFEVDHTDIHPTLDAAVMFLVDDAVTTLAELEPLPLLRSALSESKVGSTVEAAGYGMTHDGSTGRYFAALELYDIDSEYYIVNGYGERGICYGDSGGPLLVELDGFTVVAGVESWGDWTCVDIDYLTRIDLVIDWIDDQQADYHPDQGGDDEPPIEEEPPPLDEPDDETPPQIDDDIEDPSLGDPPTTQTDVSGTERHSTDAVGCSIQANTSATNVMWMVPFICLWVCTRRR